MVDPSVHRFRMNPNGRDERSGSSDFGSAREDSRPSAFEGAARRHVRKSRSRIRRPSGNRAERAQISQKHRHSKNSTPIEQYSKMESSSASSSASRASSSSESKRSTSSSSSKQSSSDRESTQSSSDRESTQSSPISSAKSFPDKHTATMHSMDESMQAWIKPTPRGTTFQDNDSGSEDKSMQSSPGPTSKGKGISDNQSANSGSEDEYMQSSPGPTSKGKGISDNQSANSGSEDEYMQSSPGPTSKGKPIPDNDSASSGSEDEYMQSSAGPTSKGKGISDNDSASSGSEDEFMKTPPGQTSKAKSIPDNDSASSGAEDKSMQSSPGLMPKRKLFTEKDYVSSRSEDESIHSSTRPTSKAKSSPDNHLTTSSSQDESMQSSTQPTSEGKVITYTYSVTSGSEDEWIQSSTRPTSKGKPYPDNHSTTSSSEDESMQSSNRPTAKGKAFPDTRSATSNSEEKAVPSILSATSTRPTSKGKQSPDNHSTTSSSEDESMQSSNRPTPKEEAVCDTRSAISGSKDELIHYLQSSNRPTPKEDTVPDSDSATSISEDEMAKKNRRTGIESLELEEVSSTPLSEESHYENGGAEPIDDQHRKEWGDKLTVKFKVSLPEVGHDLVGGSLQFLRMPQFLPVEAGAFDAESFKDSMTPDDLKDEQARGDFLNRLKTTVRWRETQDKVKESNARIVRWSDGTETFHVGAEVFDVMHHKVIDDKNQLYVRLESCYQVQGSIGDKMTLRPKLDSTFGQSHVQGLRNRAMNKPQTGLVKVISDLVANPMVDREQRAKADLANLRKEDRLRRREIQLSLRKPRVKPMRHCTADDSDLEQPTGEQEDKIGRNSAPGIRTNRNVAVNPGKKVSTDEENDEDAYDSDVNDIINDAELDYYEDDDVDEELSDEPRASTSKPKKALRRSPMTRTRKRKTKQLVYSDSSSG